MSWLIHSPGVKRSPPFPPDPFHTCRPDLFSSFSEEILDKTTDEDLAAARKLALKFGPEEGDAPDYVNYPERTRLVNTFQVQCPQMRSSDGS